MWIIILCMLGEYFKMNNKIHKTVHRKHFDEVDFLLHNFKRDEKMMKRFCSFILSRFKNTLDFKEHAIKLLLLFRSTPVLCEKVRNWIAASTRPFASLWEKGCKRKKRYRKCMSEKKASEWWNNIYSSDFFWHMLSGNMQKGEKTSILSYRRLFI